MMHFVHTWNQQIETALDGTFSLQRITEKLEKTKEQVKFLTGVIREQEEELGEVKERNVTLERGSAWILKNQNNENYDEEDEGKLHTILYFFVCFLILINQLKIK